MSTKEREISMQNGACRVLRFVILLGCYVHYALLILRASSWSGSWRGARGRGHQAWGGGDCSRTRLYTWLPQVSHSNFSSSPSTFRPHRFDEQVNLVLKSSDPEKLPELSRKFVRVSALATITHLKKFIAIKVLNMPKDDEDIFR